MSPAARIFTAVQCVHSTVVSSATTCTAVQWVPYSTLTPAVRILYRAMYTVLPVLRIFQIFNTVQRESQ